MVQFRLLITSAIPSLPPNVGVEPGCIPEKIVMDTRLGSADADTCICYLSRLRG